jgi:hypothetical protein
VIAFYAVDDKGRGVFVGHSPLMPTRGIRNNNPGNMEPGGWQGEVGNDGRFAVFDTMANGIRALAKQLLVYQDKYGIKTARGVVSRWAPPNENNTDGYLAFFDGVLGCGPDDEFNFHNRDFLYWACTAIGEEENGHDEFTRGVSDADLNAGVNAALA